MKRVNIYQHQDYRQLLDELLELNQLSYRQLASSSQKIVSFPLLAKVLIKDPHGTYKGHQNLSPEKLALLLDFFGYNQEEVQFGLLMRFENDIRSLPHQRGSLAKSVLKKAVQASRRRAKSAKGPKPHEGAPMIRVLGSLFDQLPEESRSRVLKALTREALIVAERTKNVPGSARIQHLIGELKNLT